MITKVRITGFGGQGVITAGYTTWQGCFNL